MIPEILYTDLTNLNQLQSHLLEKNVNLISPQLIQSKQKSKIQSSKKYKYTQQPIHVYTFSHNPTKQQSKTNQPVLSSRSLL